jgi:hypothetical protein
MNDTLTYIFLHSYDYCKINFQYIFKILKEKYGKNLNKKHKMHISEVITIIICFPLSCITNFKAYYRFIKKYYNNEFRNLYDYKTFSEYKNMLASIIENFQRYLASQNSSENAYIDRLSIKACHNKRRNTYKVLKSISANGKGTMGFHTGLKGFLVQDMDANILFFDLTAGNKADNNVDILIDVCNKSNAKKYYADKGFMLCAENKLKIEKLNKKIITRNRSNMEKAILTEEDDKILRKRSRIETTIDILKNRLNIEHTRHRSINGFFTHVYSVLIAYFFKRKYNISNVFF